jgi:hypothetical protein
MRTNEDGEIVMVAEKKRIFFSKDLSSFTSKDEVDAKILCSRISLMI